VSTANDRDASLALVEDVIDTGHPDSAQHLLEHIARYGTEHFDAQALAERVLAIGDEEDEDGPEDTDDRDERTPFWSDSPYG
jgi:hypothetical protein